MPLRLSVSRTRLRFDGANQRLETQARSAVRTPLWSTWNGRTPSGGMSPPADGSATTGPGAELATVGQCIGLGLSSAALADEDVRADAGYGFAWQMRQVVERILSQLALRCYYLLFVAAIGAAQRSSAWGKLHPGTTAGHG